MLDPLVLDASAWLAVILEEERCEDVTSAMVHHTLLAPDLLRYETANGVLHAKRAGRLAGTPRALKEALELIRAFPIRAVETEVFWAEASRLVQHYPLTFYDAAYLGTAAALKVPLLTLDGQVRAVMRQERIAGVPTQIR
jgi:predicted nucleic acid-binding protein